MPRALRPAPRILRRAAVVGLLLSLLVPAAALAGNLTPEHGGSPNADRINTLYVIVLVMAILIFLLVEGVLIYSIFKFRRRRRDEEPAQIRGNTTLEVGWTVGAALILVVLAVFTFIELPGIRNPPNSGPDGIRLANGTLLATGAGRRLPPNGKSLNICVNGQQYIWRYTYAADCGNAPLNSPFSYTEMVVPVETTVTLDINAQDVDHSWWIPKLGGKFDAIPGYTNHTWFKIPAKWAGHTFHGQCAELCGRNHANMIAQVRAVTPAEYERWLAQQKADVAAADKAAAQARPQVQKELP